MFGQKGGTRDYIFREYGRSTANSIRVHFPYLHIIGVGDLDIFRFRSVSSIRSFRLGVLGCYFCVVFVWVFVLF